MSSPAPLALARLRFSAGAGILALAAVAFGGCGGGSALPRTRAMSPSQALYREGQAAVMRGEMEDALQRFRSSLEIARKEKDREGVASNLHAIAMIHIQRKEWREALGHMEETLRMDREAVRRGRQGRLARERLRLLEAKVVSDLVDIARIHRRLYAPRAALERLREALAIDLRLGRERGAAITHNNIGRLLLALDQLDEAERHFRAALGLFEKLSDEKSVETVRRNLAFLGRIRGLRAPAGR